MTLAGDAGPAAWRGDARVAGIERVALVPVYLDFSAEHGVVSLDGPSEWPRVGDRLALEVNYTDQALHLLENLFGIRDGVVAAMWPVACRGRMQEIVCLLKFSMRTLFGVPQPRSTGLPVGGSRRTLASGEASGTFKVV